MKKNVILLAGGSGSRFGSNIPKQFVCVDNTPLIIYTLRKIQLLDIDNIIIVCVDSWKEELRNLVKKYQIKKVYSVISGGQTGHDSIFLGLEEAKKITESNDIVVLHDAVRPLITKHCFDDVIEKAIKHNAACAALKITEGLVIKETEEYGKQIGDRFNTVRVQTPQAYKFKLLYDIYSKANKKEIKYSYADAACILNDIPLYFSTSFVTNIKITTRSDLAFFKALMNFSDDELEGE